MVFEPITVFLPILTLLPIKTLLQNLTLFVFILFWFFEGEIWIIDVCF